jgi:hypothetical protein
VAGRVGSARTPAFSIDSRSVSGGNDGPDYHEPVLGGPLQTRMSLRDPMMPFGDVNQPLSLARRQP